MLEPQYPEYSRDMYLRGFSASQIYSAFKQTQRRKQKDKRKKREQSILEKELYDFTEAVLSSQLEIIMKDLFKDKK